MCVCARGLIFIEGRMAGVSSGLEKDDATPGSWKSVFWETRALCVSLFYAGKHATGKRTAARLLPGKFGWLAGPHTHTHTRAYK